MNDAPKSLRLPYSPDEGDGWEAEIVFSQAGMPRLLGAEILAIERGYLQETGERKGFGDIFAEMAEGVGAALLTVIWVLRKRQVPTLRFDDFCEEFDFGFLDISALLEAAEAEDSDVEDEAPKADPATSAPAKKRSPKAS